MVSLKRHSIMTFELTPRGRWIDRQGSQLFIGQSAAGSTLDFCAQSLDQFRRTFVRVHWLAAQTRTIAAMQSFARCREEIDILARRLFRRASGPAKNPGGANTDVENPFKTRITINQRAIHRV